MDGIQKYDPLYIIENSPKNISINFNEFSKVNIKAKEIYNCTISGYFSNKKGEFHGNIVLSLLKDFISDNTNFDFIDWKDSNIRDCKFKANIFDNGAFINCHIANTKIKSCKFKNVSITGTTFYYTDFLDCDLSNMIIENCYFYNCHFGNCKTSNKLFEQCLFSECLFEATDIQLETIIENVGIEYNQLLNSGIRDNPVEKGFKYISSDELLQISLNKGSSMQSIFKFKIEFFLKPDVVLIGSELFNSIFHLKEWIILCKAQSTFLNMYKLYHDFLIILFEQNRLPVFILYKFHELTTWLSDHPQIKDHFELFPTFIGYRISLSRMLGQIDNLINKYNIQGSIKLITEGPLEREFYYSKLGSYIRGNFKIMRVLKMNSPNIVEITAIASVIIQFIALFLTTRVKAEIIKGSFKKKRKKTKKIQKVDKINSSPNPYKLTDFDMKYEDSLKMYFEQSLFKQIDLSKFKTQDCGKVRRVLVDISFE